jgi:hypothetical protein
MLAPIDLNDNESSDLRENLFSESTLGHCRIQISLRSDSTILARCSRLDALAGGLDPQHREHTSLFEEIYLLMSRSYTIAWRMSASRQWQPQAIPYGDREIPPSPSLGFL